MLSNEQMVQYAEFDVLYKIVEGMRDDMRFEVNSTMQREKAEKLPFFDGNGKKLGSITCVMDTETESKRVEVHDRAEFEKWIGENADLLLYDDIAQIVFNYTGEVPSGCDTVTVSKVKKGYVRPYPSKEYKAEIIGRVNKMLEAGDE